MSRKTIFILIFFFVFMQGVCLGAEPPTAMAPSKTLPFKIGEKLRYTLKWSVIPVGTAVFEVLDGTAATGTPSFLFRLTVESHPVIDLIYKVRDHIESFTDRAVTRSLLYKKKQREGRHRRDILIRFDWNQRKAIRYNKGIYESTVDVPLHTFDPLGIFYAFRLNTVTDDLRVEIPVTDGKKTVPGRAKVVRRETVITRRGVYDTFLIEPDLQHVGGVFEKSKDAIIQVWVTADDRQIVVKLRSKVVVGHFTGELVSAEGLID